MAGSKWQLWWKMIKAGVSHPRQFFSALSIHNLRTFWFALKYEPPRLIWQNFLHLLQNKEDRARLYFQQLQIDRPEFRMYFERVQRQGQKIILTGWVISKTSGIQHIEVLADKLPIGIFRATLDRPGLEGQYGRAAQSAGFDFLGTYPEDVDAFTCVIHFEDGTTQSLTVPEVEDEKAYETYLLLSELDEDYIRRTRKLLRKTTKSLPSFRLQVTEDQWALLHPARHKYPFPVYRQSSESPPGTHILQLDQTCLPAPTLLWEVTRSLMVAKQEPDLLYWDEDELLPSGKRRRPHFKPAFDLHYLLSWNYIGYNFCYRARMAEPNPTPALLVHPIQLCTASAEFRAIRIPKVLSHAQKIAERPLEIERTIRHQFLAKQQPQSACSEGILPGTWRIQHPVDDSLGVTLIIPFRDKVELLKQCLKSLHTFNSYPNTSVLLINNQSEEPETLEYLREITSQHAHIQALDYDAPFNYPAIHNWAVRHVDTPYVLLLNNDTEFIREGTLEALMEYAQLEGVGAVGAKLLYPDNSIQHAGVIVGIGGVADHAHKYLPRQAEGYFYRANTVQQFSACTAACLMVATDLYRQVGGMDEDRFPIAFNDVDFCLKLRSLGQQVIYTPYACLYHHESLSRGTDQTPEQKARSRREIQAFQKKWRTFLAEGDPFYHPQLSLRSGHFELARS